MKKIDLVRNVFYYIGIGLTSTIGPIILGAIRRKVSVYALNPNLELIFWFVLFTVLFIFLDTKKLLNKTSFAIIGFLVIVAGVWTKTFGLFEFFEFVILFSLISLLVTFIWIMVKEFKNIKNQSE